MATTEQRRKRLRPEIFDLPVEKMREGWYTDAYFNHARDTLLADGRHPRVVMQVFQKNEAVLGGMDEALAVLKLCSHDWEALTVHALYDGDEVAPLETVMTIEGDFTLFAHLETVYLGVLARRTLVSTNTRRVIEAASRKPIIFMPARHDHHSIQTGDGYAAHVAGAAHQHDVAHRIGKRRDKLLRHVPGRPSDTHHAFRGVEEPGQAFQHRRFAAAVRPQQGEGLARG